MLPFDYSAPPARIPGYLCLECGKNGVKLWQQLGYYTRGIILRCLVCACRHADIHPSSVNADGQIYVRNSAPKTGYSATTQLANQVPAIPAFIDDGVLTFYQAGAVTDVARNWWKALPLR